MTATAPSPVAGAAVGADVLAAPKVAIFLLGALGGIQAVDPLIASTALVSASRGLGMEGALVAFAASVSTLMLAATVISMGLLGDRIGWRRLLELGLVVSIVGDLMAAAAPGSVVFLLGRAVAGVGLGAVFAASFAYIRIITPSEKVPAALGVYAATGSVVLVCCSLFGGVAASVDWRIAFLIVPAGCALCLVLARLLLPVTLRRSSGPMDVPGQVLLGLGIIGVLFGLSHLSRGAGAPAFWLSMSVGALLLASFVVVERRGAHPFFPVEVLRNPVFLGAVCAGFIYNFAQSATILQFSNLWQYVDGLEPARVSAGTLPFLLIGIVAALVTGRMITNGLRNRTVVLLGGALAAAGGLSTLLHQSGSPYVSLLPALLLIGYGATMASIPYGGLIVRAAAGKMAPFYGPITSSRTTIGQIAYAAGLALSTVMVDGLAKGGVTKRLVDAGVPPARTGSALDTLGVYMRTGKDPATSAASQALQLGKESYAASFKITMVAVGVLCLLVGLVGARLLRGVDDPGRSGRAAEPTPPVAEVAAH